MARGFDSKSVSDQQEEKERERERKERPAAAPVSARRRNLELARVDLLRRLEGAPDSYREALKAALAALEDQIREA
jgi:hypothetical protein